MDTQAVDGVIDWFCRKLEESGIRVTMIVLFGSYAKNRISQHSDIDLAVITPDFENVHILDRIPMVSEAEWSTVRKFNVPLDLILPHSRKNMNMRPQSAYSCRQQDK